MGIQPQGWARMNAVAEIQGEEQMSVAPAPLPVLLNRKSQAARLVCATKPEPGYCPGGGGVVPGRGGFGGPVLIV